MGPAHCLVNVRRSFLVLSFLLIHKKVMSELNCKPMDAESLVNETTYFNCSSSIITKEIHWYHYPVGAQLHQRNTVYAFGKLYEDYEKDFELDKNSSHGAYNLVIRSTKPGYAGRYECQDNGGVGNSCTAQLVVLDNVPECSSNINPHGVIGSNTCGIQPDELQLSCSISYHGIILPELAWYWLGKNDSIRSNVTEEQSNGHFTYKLNVKADELRDKSLFECQTTKSRTTKHSCISETVDLLYNLGASSVSIKNIGEEVNCSANTSSQFCQYKWYDKDSLTVANNRILKVNKTGEHRCEATCDLRNMKCTVNAMTINATDAGSETTDDSHGFSHVGVVLGVVLSLPVITIVIVAIFLWLRHKRSSKHEGDVVNCELGGTAVPLLTENGITGVVLSDGFKESEDPLLAKNRIEGTTENTAIIIQDEEETGAKEEQPVSFLPDITDKDLTHVEILNRANIEQTAITGLTVLNKELFVAFEQTSELEVFHAITFNPLRTITVKDIENPLDMVSSPMNNCLYISSPKDIHRVDASGKVILKWPIEDGGGTLSVTDDPTVILSDMKRTALMEYSADGELINDVKLPSDIHPFHAVKTMSDQFVVSLQHRMVHKVAIFDTDGTFIKSFSGILKFPKYLVVNSDGFIFVAEQKNSRVLMMSPTLDSSKVLLSQKDELDRPSRICLDEENSRIFVADNKTDNIRFMVFKLQRCEIGTNEDIAVNRTDQTKPPESKHVLTGDMDDEVKPRKRKRED